MTAFSDRIEIFQKRVETRGVGGALRHAALVRALWALNLLPSTERTDRLYAYLDFVSSNGRRPRNRPLYNDYMYALKVSGELSSPLRVRTTDKELVKRHVGERIGERHTVPTLATLRTEAEIRAFDFPERCAIKPTHSTGRKILREQGEPIDLDSVVAWLDHDQFAASREANYRGLERKIIVEPLLAFTYELAIFSVRGSVTLLHARRPVSRMFSPRWIDLDTTWRSLLDKAEEPVAPPPNLEAIVADAEALGRDFDFVRVDMYVGLPDGGYAVGELTHCPASAATRFANDDHEAYITSIVFPEGIPQLPARPFATS